MEERERERDFREMLIALQLWFGSSHKFLFSTSETCTEVTLRRAMDAVRDLKANLGRSRD